MSGLIWNSELQGGSPRLCQLRSTSVGSEWTNTWLCTGAYGTYGIPITKTEAILPYLTGVQWVSTWATHGVSAEAYVWKTCTRVRWALIIPLTVSWTITTRGALVGRVCHVVRFIPLQGWLLIWISVTPLDMGDGLFAESKCSNSTFIMLYLVHEMHIDCLVVDEMINVSKLFDYTCMLRIRCKPMMLIT
jgi:hypothetical protein